ncbi:hypothetical protein [Cohaesibacter celericrescens]|uniref:Cytoplasmic protein n=1 Tax=Cohaesibacter celericrescens TaxID=2067669 RepID=A0A2N5XXD0_9HYPH|nr:hypothetical protein [Cohaesibacter celericrescens]PLW79139.1 hypothetical protein C0081_02620 [Cohaesibacter celericrescens]
MKHPHLFIAGALLLSAGATASASVLPDCDRSDVISRVTRTISVAEQNVVQSGDPVKQIDHIRQSKLRDNGPRYVAQRFCRATGYTEQGRKKNIYYLIEAKAGFAGYGYAVEACITGRDPWKLHGAYCRSLR